uniref:Uncharacterized protein n=1 Tax=Rhizophora mucronata TaxID=61149 RepID=A0A2P2P219_RHIMU
MYAFQLLFVVTDTQIIWLALKWLELKAHHQNFFRSVSWKYYEIIG